MLIHVNPLKKLGYDITHLGWAKSSPVSDAAWLPPVTPGEGHLRRSRENLEQFPREGGLEISTENGKTVLSYGL